MNAFNRLGVSFRATPAAATAAELAADSAEPQE
jgi:hypothetical protein